MSKFILTAEMLHSMHDRLNAELFDGILRRVQIIVGRSVKRLGEYSYRLPHRFRGMFRSMSSGEKANFVRSRSRITISSVRVLDAERAERVLAHEMIHQWVLEERVLERGLKLEHHGPCFRRKMREVNAIKGEGFATVRCDTNGWPVGGDDGKVYHVAVFLSGGVYLGGCFSPVPFDRRAKRLIRVTTEGYSCRDGSPITADVFRTTSHAAQLLPDVRRIRTLDRRRKQLKWPWRSGVKSTLQLLEEGRIP